MSPQELCFYKQWTLIKIKPNMPLDPSAYDKERIAHINHLMDTINDSTSEIYELLIDREFNSLKKEIKNLMSILKDISTSVEDDI